MVLIRAQVEIQGPGIPLGLRQGGGGGGERRRKQRPTGLKNSCSLRKSEGLMTFVREEGEDRGSSPYLLTLSLLLTLRFSFTLTSLVSLHNISSSFSWSYIPSPFSLSSSLLFLLSSLFTLHFNVTFPYFYPSSIPFPPYFTLPPSFPSPSFSLPAYLFLPFCPHF